MNHSKSYSQIILLISFCFTFVQSIAQDRIAYYDALTFAQLYQANRSTGVPLDAETWEILKYYFTNKDDLQSDVASNQFLKKYFDTGGSSSLTSVSDLSIIKNGVSTVSGGIGGLNVTNIATGFAQFLIGRANEEVNIMFFNKFKKFLAENEEAATLFPTSTNFITNSEPSQYALLMQSFKEAFKEDIKNLVNNIDDLLLLDRYQQFGRDHPEAYAGLAAAASVSKLVNGGNVADVIKSLGNFDNPSTTNESKNLYSAIKLMTLLSESVRSEVDGEAWVSASIIQTNIINDPDALNIYFGLIYQRSSGIEFVKGGITTSVQTILINAQADVLKLKSILTYFKTLESKWANIKKLQQEIERKKNNNEKVEYTEYYIFFNANIDLIETLLDVNTVLSKLGNSFNIKGIKETRSYLTVLKKGNEIYKNINEENYSSAVLNFVIVYETVIGKRIDEIIVDKRKEMKTFLDKAGVVYTKTNVRKKYKKQVLATQSIVFNNDNFKKKYKENKDDFKIGIPKNDFLKYSTFMASIVEAKNPEDVKNIIKAAALPAGSSSIKKNSSFNVSLQSYIGVYHNFDSNNDLERAWNNKFGIIAPLGISANLGLPKKFGSIGIFASLLDVGAIVDYEIRRDTTLTTSTTIMDTTLTTTTVESIESNIDYKIELGQLFSPGIYLVWGLPLNMPLTFGLGWQRGPGLTEIKDKAAVIGKPENRFNFFIAFDIPIMTIMNTKRGKYPKNK